MAACAAGAHLASIFSMNLGAVSFAQIVKASEPAFAAVVGTTLYGKHARPVIGDQPIVPCA